MDIRSELTRHLKELHLPTFREDFEDVARFAEKESLTYEQYLLELSIKECEARRPAVTGASNDICGSHAFRLKRRWMSLT